MTEISKENMREALIQYFGPKEGEAYYTKYKNAFHVSYYEETPVEKIIFDIQQLEKLSPDKPFEITLYPASQVAEKYLHLRLFQLENPIPLSDILPILENMNLRTLNERPYVLRLENTLAWISDFNVEYMSTSKIDLENVKLIFQEAFRQIYLRESENDQLNKLVLGAKLNCREITILRTYTKYLQQIGFKLSQAYIQKTVAEYADLSALLIGLFIEKFTVDQSLIIDKITETISGELDKITSLEHDRVMRSLFLLIQATLRTNYIHLFKTKEKNYLSIKLKSALVPGLPLPKPLYEIFIYSPQFSGIHLRSTKVSRGGIRWSDRREDFRTEILGLMKAQRVKNAVIVPSGAKGGFVLHGISSFVDKSVFENEVVHCYKQFISGLLDITDNIINDACVHPEGIICFDDYDPYFVVAADKGTGNFSDIANQLANDYQFWLGDAFASGGSAGYNHKTMGITARGAWESIKRHFLGLNININKDYFTVVGIGDMSGDVFGNGLMYSSHAKLIAAFDHRDIFIDPAPDAEHSFDERVRLFNLPRSSWQDYNKALISQGGGVFSRKAKSIELSHEIRKCLAIEDHTLAPDDLVKAILKAPVDLLYNGGIGTYIKASYENNVEVGDRANDECRIHGNEVRARVIGEGGNLGVTQLGRIEYAMQGGNIFTDFIDNSGGVDCSDHEVNIKILLNQVIADGKLHASERNQLLQSMQDDVARLVLDDNYQQAQALALSSSRVSYYSGLYQHYLKELEEIGDLNRAIEFLPDDKMILDRKAHEQGITTPELAILLEYSKIYIKNEILASHLPEESYLATLVEHAFPALIKKKFPEYMANHRLHREIIATQLSNKVVNEMGMTFVYREKIETGASIPEVICAYIISSEVFQSDELRKIIDGLDFTVPAKLQYELLYHFRHLINLSTRWFLRSHYLTKDIAKTIKHFSVPIKKLIPMLPDLMSGTTKHYLESLADQFASAGIPRKTAERIASYRAIYIFLNVIEVATRHQFELAKTAQLYFNVGAKFNLVWFRDQISSDMREGHWNAMARLRLRDELDTLQKSLTVAIMLAYQNETDTNRMIDHWCEKHPRPVGRWNEMLQLLHSTDNIDYTMFFIALGELSDWVHVEDVTQLA